MKIITLIRRAPPEGGSGGGWGPFIKDIRTEGGGGLRNLQILMTNSTDRSCDMRRRGREGVENPKNFVDILYEWSLAVREGAKEGCGNLGGVHGS